MKCTFCGSSVAQGTGIMLVRNTGRIMGFCSRKCEKNMIKLGRIPRNVKWTAAARAEKQKRGAKK